MCTSCLSSSSTGSSQSAAASFLSEVLLAAAQLDASQGLTLILAFAQVNTCVSINSQQKREKEKCAGSDNTSVNKEHLRATALNVPHRNLCLKLRART